MIICLCNNIDDKKFTQMAKDGYEYKCIFKHLDMKLDCGSCIKEIKKIFLDTSPKKK